MKKQWTNIKAGLLIASIFNFVFCIVVRTILKELKNRILIYRNDA